LGNKERLQLILLFKGALLRKMLPGLLLVSLLTSSLVLMHLHTKELQLFNLKISAALPGYMGAALGLLLVFRNSTAYEKWWEARKEMGALVNTTRNFALCLNAFLPFGHPMKSHLIELLDSYVFTLKDHLRDKPSLTPIDSLSDKEQRIITKAEHKPNIIANLMMVCIEDLWKNKDITDLQQFLLVEKINLLIDIQGKCERIKNTPIPMAYGFLLKFFINIYVIILPFSLIDDIGWGCVPLVMLLYYILMSIVVTAEEIEEPFGTDLNDLKMDLIAYNIGNNIREIIGHE
jgi:putative membrane protein